MGSMAFLTVWAPVSVTMLAVSMALHSYARSLDDPRETVPLDPHHETSATTAGGVGVPLSPFGADWRNPGAREYRLYAAAMLAGSVCALLLGVVQVF